MLKKLFIITIASTAALSLSGCSGLASNALIANASFETGLLLGQSTTQETLDLLSDGTIETYCSDFAAETESVSTIDEFSAEEFTKGCIQGFEENQ
jgi:hypothetical protein